MLSLESFSISKLIYFCIGLIILAAFVILGNIYLTNTQTSPSEILSLDTEIRNTELKWTNENILTNILNTRGVYTSGIYSNKLDSYQKVNKVRIVLVSKEQTLVPIIWVSGDQKIQAASSDYEVKNDTLILKIYVIAQKDPIIFNKLFNRQVISTIFYATAQVSTEKADTNSKIRVLDQKGIDQTVSAFGNNFPISINTL